MIQYDKTKEEFGYDVRTLSEGSHKKIVVSCDYCGKEYFPTYKNYLISKKKYPLMKKDSSACCASVKAKEIQILDGTFESKKKEMMGKQQKTCERKYGSGDWMRELVRKSWREASPERKEEIQKAKKEGVIKKYGVEFISQVPSVRAKARETLRARHGGDNPSKIEKFKRKRRETMKARFGADQWFSSIAFRDRMIKDGVIKLYDGKTIEEWAQVKGISRGYATLLFRERGFEFVKEFDGSKTDIEEIISDILKKNDIEFIFNKRIDKGDDVVPDFYIPSANLVIEADGLFYHSDAFKNNEYHTGKREKYLSKGILPLFFRADELKTKGEIVESIILNKLGKIPHRIFARKCSFHALPSSEAKSFLDYNHLMGGAGKCYGLKDENGEIVAVLQVEKHRKSQGTWEISRFCTRNLYSVIGGYSKLMKGFLQENKGGCKEVFSFVDLRYGKGDYLEKLGWTSSPPSPSFRWTNGNVCLHRLNFFGNSGYKKGFLKIWDCGQARYTLELTPSF